jgi:sialic acid synthase SpsE
MRTFIIAEIGVNHNGSLDLALELVEAVAASGANAAKFQTFRADAITTRNTEMVAYQRRSVGVIDQHEMLRSLELSVRDHEAIAAHCANLGIEFISTAFDSESLDLLCRLGVKRLKVASGELTNGPLLRDCAARGLPIVLSTGMATLDEVRDACAMVSAAQAARPPASSNIPPLVVLHCTSAYPAPPADVNLMAMSTMATSLGLPVGYSDHTQGILVPPIAVAMGATMIEKHVTLDRSMPGPDHAASIEPVELRAMIEAIGTAEALLGDGEKAPRPSELEARRLVRRGLKAARDLSAGEVLTHADLAILRPATGLPPNRLDTVVGKTISRALPAGAPLYDDHLSD